MPDKKDPRLPNSLPFVGPPNRRPPSSNGRIPPIRGGDNNFAEQIVHHFYSFAVLTLFGFVAIFALQTNNNGGRIPPPVGENNSEPLQIQEADALATLIQRSLQNAIEQTHQVPIDNSIFNLMIRLLLLTPDNQDIIYRLTEVRVSRLNQTPNLQQDINRAQNVVNILQRRMNSTDPVYSTVPTLVEFICELPRGSLTNRVNQIIDN